MELGSKFLRFLTVTCLMVGLVASQTSYGKFSKAKRGDPAVQGVADRIKDQVQASDAAGQLSLYKLVQYKTRTVNTNRPEGGFANGTEYYMKKINGKGNFDEGRIEASAVHKKGVLSIEASTGKFIQVNAVTMEDIGEEEGDVVLRTVVNTVKSTTKDAEIRIS